MLAERDFIRREPAVMLISIIAVALTLRLCFAAGISGSDDLAIAWQAMRILQHGLHLPTSHYAARIGLTLPLAAIFRLFGVGVPQLIALSMAASLLGVALAYRIGRDLFDTRVGLVAAAVVAVYPLDVESAGLLSDDLIQGVALAAVFALALQARRGSRGNLCAIAAGLCWAYAYYVKIDAFFMGPVLLIATVLGFLRWRDLVIICSVTGLLVGAELVVYGAMTGSPFLHVALEREGANEVLAPGMDYRELLANPKAMFVTPYETGLTFYLLFAAIVAAIAVRFRPALMLCAWVLVFLTWLTVGGDPFGQHYRFKPQLIRYVQAFTAPMAVLVGWFLVWAYTRLSRWAVIAVGTAGIGLALVFMQFNVLNYEAPMATRIATQAALRHNWFPLYTDSQSEGVAQFILYGMPQQHQVLAAEHHNFLTGTTSFAQIFGSEAYLLINNDYVRRLQSRNLVSPLSPKRFEMRRTLLLSVTNPAPPRSYAILRILKDIAALVPVASIRRKVAGTTADVLRDHDAEVYRLVRQSAPTGAPP